MANHDQIAIWDNIFHFFQALNENNANTSILGTCSGHAWKTICFFRYHLWTPKLRSLLVGHLWHVSAWTYFLKTIVFLGLFVSIWLEYVSIFFQPPNKKSPIDMETPWQNWCDKATLINGPEFEPGLNFSIPRMVMILGIKNDILQGWILACEIIFLYRGLTSHIDWPECELTISMGLGYWIFWISVVDVKLPRYSLLHSSSENSFYLGVSHIYKLIAIKLLGRYLYTRSTGSW